MTCTAGRGGGRGRDSPKQTPCGAWSPDTKLDLATPKSQSGLKPRVQRPTDRTTQAPLFLLLKENEIS